VHRQFELRAARTPEALAIEGDGRSLTYGEVNRRANRLAHRLIALGVGPEVTVAILARRTPEAIVWALAVLKAGGGYLPLDPSNPEARLAALARL
jgi:non-ribosomal peptide synthetase component F